MSTEPKFFHDENGYPVSVLAPDTLTSFTLSSSAAIALRSDRETHRILRLHTTEEGVVIGVGTSAASTLPLVANMPEYVKLEAGMNLYAKGSGVLNITVMG